MNILGQPFAPWVTKQIETRQQSLGYVDYDANDLLYQNNKTPWIRLASSVDIMAVEGNDGVLEQFEKMGVPRNAMIGGKAAKNFILQGGAVGVDDNGNIITYQGLNTTDEFYKGAYGWGETTERGFVPLPGILDANLIYQSNGALAKATINMKCFSRNQLALMDALYMRPGYNCLLEFGWSSWLHNETKKVTTFNQFQSPALEHLLLKDQTAEGTNPSNFEIPFLIQQERIKTYGNYEGVFGKITNFNWTFNPDGSYSCQTILTGMGGVIESLKINGASYTKEEMKNLKAYKKLEATVDDVTSLDEADDYSDKKVMDDLRSITELTNKLVKIKESYKKVGAMGSLKGNTNPKFMTKSLEGFADPQDNFKKKKLTIKNALIGIANITSDKEDASNPQLFLSFGYFLALIQNEFLIYNEKGDPYFTFDMDFNNLPEDDNYILNLPGQFSANPNICWTPYTGLPIFKDQKSYTFFTTTIPPSVEFNMGETAMGKAFEKINKDFLVDSGESQFLGRLAYVYLNYDYIIDCIEKTDRNKDDNSMALLPFLKSILSGICKSRGGLNSIAIHEDINTNTIKFIEEVPQNWKNEIPPKSEADRFCKINTFGVKNKVEGSIVRKIELNGTISSDFANMITIGAQSNGNKVNENSVAFSKFNKGLIDRTFKEKFTDKDEVTSTVPPDKKELDTLKSIWNDQMNKQPYTDANGAISLWNQLFNDGKWNIGNVTTIQNSNITFVSLLQGRLASNNQITSPSFLPFKLSLDIDGISGIKLYQKFNVDDNVLPPSYEPDSVDLQISSADHTVSSTDWITKITTQSVPRSKETVETEVQSLTGQKQSTVATNQENVPTVPDGTVTITSGFPLGDIYYPQVTPKTQIYIHHTAGGQNIEQEIGFWNDGTEHISTHYIANNSGLAEQLYVDEYWANHLGVKGATFKKLGLNYINLNKKSLGIELSSYGGLDVVEGGYKTIWGQVLPESSVARPVNDKGEVITYKGYAYYEKYSNAQIASLKSVVQGWMSKYNIPFIYDYDVLFNPSSLSKKALKGEKGVYTHNSVRLGKQDVSPQKDLIAMLKSIATGSSSTTTFAYKSANASVSFSPQYPQVGQTVVCTIVYSESPYPITTESGEAEVRLVGSASNSVDVAKSKARLRAQGKITDKLG